MGGVPRSTEQNLIEDGLGDLVKEVDAYEVWKEDAEEGEIRTIRMYRKMLSRPIIYSNNNDQTCAIESLSTVGRLLGMPDFVEGAVLRTLFPHGMTRVVIRTYILQRNAQLGIDAVKLLIGRNCYSGWKKENLVRGSLG